MLMEMRLLLRAAILVLFLVLELPNTRAQAEEEDSLGE
jgi:hypothetical protein